MFLKSSSSIDRQALAALLADRLRAARADLEYQWSRDPIPYAIIDDLLPPVLANALCEAFPQPDKLVARRSLREQFYVARNAAQLPALVEEAVRAFQEPTVSALLSEIFDAPQLMPDSNLSSSGVTVMTRGGFLTPHLDQSHDPLRRNYRVLRTLFYLTPDWRLSDGGHLELWHDGPDGEPTLTLAKFNRLIVLATRPTSWYSISRVNSRRPHCCISSCYYSPHGLDRDSGEYFHADSFRARPDQKLRDWLMRREQNARELLRKTWPSSREVNVNPASVSRTSSRDANVANVHRASSREGASSSKSHD